MPSRRPGAFADAATARSGVLEALPLAPTDDAGLVRAIVQGHPGAVRVVFSRYSNLVRSLLGRLLGPHQEIEDHFQETFLRFFRHAAELRDPGALTSFVVGITLRVARGELRRRRVRRWLRLTPEGELPEPAAAVHDPSAREAVQSLYALLDELDEDTRFAFVLRHVEQYELAEVARVLDCSVATVKRRLQHAADRISAKAHRYPALAEYVAPKSPRRGGGNADG